MAKLKLLWSPDPQALLARAAAAFTVTDRVVEPLPLLVVRQGGIRDAVHDLAGASGCKGWFGTPIVVFGELPAIFAGDMAPLGALERRAITRRVLAEGKYPVLGAAARSRGFAQALDSLLGDLIAERVATESLGDMLARAGRDQWELARDNELTRLYRSYRANIAALEPSGSTARTEGRDGLSIAAEEMRLRPDLVRERLRRPFGDPATRRSMDMYGLTDLRRGWGAFLHALHDAEFLDEIRVYVQRSSDADGSSQVWTALVQTADALEELPAASSPSALTTLRDSLFAVTSEPQASHELVSAIAAPDMQRELEAVARRVKQLIVEQGVQPRRIAIVARKARPYATRAAEIFTRFGIPTTARLRHTLSDVPVTRALLRVLSASDGWTITALSELSASPYFDTDLDLGVLGHIAKVTRPRSLDAWSAAIEHARADAAALGSTGNDDIAGLDISRVDAAASSFARFAETVRPFAGERPISRWIDITLAALGAPPSRDARVAGWGNGILGLAASACSLPSAEVDADTSDLLVDAARLDSAALKGLVTLLTDWRSSMAHIGANDAWLTTSVSAREWVAALEQLLQDEEVALRTTRQNGVQVVEALAASGRPFDHTFIVGMSAGAFPADPAARLLFSDWECTELNARGLPLEPASVWFEREAGLFRSLVAAATRTLTITHSYADGDGRPQLPSAYYDEVISRFGAPNNDANVEHRPEHQLEQRLAGSSLLPSSAEALWSADDLLLYATRSWTSGGTDEKAIVRAALAHLAAGTTTRARIDHLLHVAHAEHERSVARATPIVDRRDAAHAWNGAIDDDAILLQLRERFGDRVWSATQLERYGRCGFSFFGSHVLGTKPIDTEEEEDDITGLERGVVMHDVLARVYAALLAALEDDALDPIHFGTAQSLIADAVEAALLEQPGAWAEVAGLREARTLELRRTVERYVLWDMNQSTRGKPARRKPEFVELGFGVPGASHPVVEFVTQSGTLRLRGRIDRIDTVVDPRAPGWRYVVDLKSGATAFTGSTQLQPEGALLQLALYLAATRQIFGDKIFGGAYHLVAKPDRTAKLEPASLVQQGLRVTGNDTQVKADAIISNAPALALSLIGGIVSGRFAARPPGTVKCLRYCDLRDVCREERMGER